MERKLRDLGVTPGGVKWQVLQTRFSHSQVSTWNSPAQEGLGLGSEWAQQYSKEF